MKLSEERYEHDLKEIVRELKPIQEGELVYLDTQDGTATSNKDKLQNIVAGPFQVLKTSRRTVIIKCVEVIERVTIELVTKETRHL